MHPWLYRQLDYSDSEEKLKKKIKKKIQFLSVFSFLSGFRDIFFAIDNRGNNLRKCKSR